MYILVISLILLNTVIHIETMIVSCNGTVLNGAYYEREKLCSGFEKPYNLVMYDSTGELFFSHTIRYRNELDFTITVCDVKTKMSKNVLGITGGYAIAYDRIHDEIYFGGHDGIYRYDPRQRATVFFAEKGKSIWGLFVRQEFYYIEYPSQTLYVFKDGRFVRDTKASMPIQTFYITEEDISYYSNETTLFKADGNNPPFVLHDDVNVRQIAEDSTGEIYFSTNEGIFMETARFTNIRKVIPERDTYGVTFDANGMLIYSDNNTIYKLQPSKYSKMCLKALRDAAREASKTRDRIVSIF